MAKGKTELWGRELDVFDACIQREKFVGNTRIGLYMRAETIAGCA